jgi:hypothetical protein
MSKGAQRASADTKRRFVRVPLTGPIGYRYGVGDEGRAEYANVSQTGLGLRLGRYLRPGRRVLLTLDAGPGAEEGPGTELKAQVAWCRPGKDAHVFDAGVRVFHDEPDSAATMRGLLVRGLKQVASWMSTERPVPDPHAGAGETALDAQGLPFAKLVCVVGTVSTACTVITAALWLH